MTGRSRNADTRETFSGTRTDQYNNQYVGVSQDGVQLWCEDTVGLTEQDNPFDLVKWTTLRMKLDGEYHNQYGQLISKFEMYPPDYQVSPMDSRTPFAYDAYNLAQRLAAITNPSRAYVNVPQFIGEFKDIPQLIRSIPRLLKSKGDTLMGQLNRIGEANLTWRFALRPLISDVQKLANFQNSVNQRMRMLDKLRTYGAIRRRANLSNETHNAVTKDIILQSAGTTLRADRHDDYNQHVWGTTRWNLNAGATIPYGHKELALWAQNLSAGMNSYGAFQAAWELTPWSWLIDWFVPIGDWLEANNNSVPVTCTSICLMRHTKLRSVYKVKHATWYTIHGRHMEAEERKWRQVVSPTILLLPPLANLDFLTGSQWSILSSLAMTRKGSYRAP